MREEQWEDALMKKLAAIIVTLSLVGGFTPVCIETLDIGDRYSTRRDIGCSVIEWLFGWCRQSE